MPSHPIPDAIDGQLESLLQTEMTGSPRARLQRGGRQPHAACRAGLDYERLRHLRPGLGASRWTARTTRGAAGWKPRRGYQRLAAEWAAHPIHRFPFREARFLMRNSAFLFLGGEYLFFRTGAIRNARNTRQDPQVLETWSRREPAPAQPIFDDVR